MDRDVTQLEREHARRPEDRGLALRLARALARAGARARALALAEHLLFGVEDPEAGALREQLLEHPPWQGEPELEWLDREGEEVLALALDSAERRLAIGRARGAPIEVVDLATGAAVELAAHRRATSALHFPPLPDRLATGGGDGTVRLVDLASRKRLARLGGPSSRCLRVRVAPGPDGPLLEGRWRGHRWRQPSGEQEDFPLAFVDTPHLDTPARAALDARIQRRIGELYPEFVSAGGRFPWFGTDRFLSLIGDPRFVVLGSSCGDFWLLLVTGGAELYPVTGREDAPPLRVLRDPRLVLPRGVPENQAPAAALGPGGRALLVGGAGLEADASDQLIHLFALDGSGEVRTFSGGDRVTALCLSNGGGMAAVGTLGGRVAILRLLSQREEERPALRAADAPRPVAEVGDDLREEGAPLEDPERLTLLRRFPTGYFQFPPRACHLDADRLWVFQGRVSAEYSRGLPPEERPIYRVISQLDLGSGIWVAFPYLLHGDGSCHAYQLETRWLVLSHLRATPAPEDLRCPPLPGKPRGGRPTKKAVRRELDIEVRDRWPSPTGALVALRAKDRPQEVWVVVGDDPARHRHLEVPAPVRHVAWSPGSTRLALTLDDHQVWLYGTSP